MRLAAAHFGRMADRWAALTGWGIIVAVTWYAVVSVAVFQKLNLQLTYPHLLFLGGWRELGESLLPAITWQAVAIFLAIPLVLPWLTSLISAAAGRWSCSRRTVSFAAAVFVTYLVAAGIWHKTHWKETSLWQGRLARNPHWRLIQSFLWTSEDWGPDDASPASDSQLADFLPASPNIVAAEPIPAHRPANMDQESAQREDTIGKNVILVVLESVGADYMHVHGAPYDNTPNLDAMAEHAWVCDSIYAQCPSSAKALVSITTGTYPSMQTREQTREADAQLPSLACELQTQGYRTAFFHSGNWAWRGGDDFILRHGFQTFRDARGEPLAPGSWGVDDHWLVDQTCRFIDQAASPFFVMCWTIQSHHPYRHLGEPRDFGVEDQELGRYLNSIRDADAVIGRLWEELRRRNLSQSTILVVTGDHGEAFGQHAQRLHIFGLYEENVHVPLMFIHDGSLPIGRTNAVGQQIDIPATTADLLNLKTTAAWQGRSMFDQDHPRRAYFYSVWDPVLLGVREGKYKYILQPDWGERLFNLQTDPLELDDLAQSDAARLPDFRERISALRKYQQTAFRQTAVVK